MTARVKISENVLAKVFLVHLTVKQSLTLRVVSTFTGQNALTVFDWLYLRQNLTRAEFFAWSLVHSCETIHCLLTDVLCESGRTAHA